MREQTAEKWRTIPDFPAYVISNKGRVANRQRGTIKAISDGIVRLSAEGWTASRSHRRLMREVWPSKKQSISKK
jgi:hypothetical protein